MSSAFKVRLIAAIKISTGAIVSLLSWIIPQKLSDFVAICNTVAGDLASRQDIVLGSKCAAANFITSFRFIFILGGLATIAQGLYVYTEARSKAMQEELGVEETAKGQRVAGRDELLRVAQIGASAIVGAMATDAWGEIRTRVLRVLGRGDDEWERAEAERLDDAKAALTDVHRDERARVTGEIENDVRAWLEDRLRSNDLLVSALAALLKDLHPIPDGTPQPADWPRQVGRSDRGAVTVQADRDATGNIHVGDKNLDNRRYSFSDPLGSVLNAAKVLRRHPLPVVLTTALVLGGTVAVIAKREPSTSQEATTSPTSGVTNPSYQGVAAEETTAATLSAGDHLDGPSTLQTFAEAADGNVLAVLTNDEGRGVVKTYSLRSGEELSTIDAEAPHRLCGMTLIRRHDGASLVITTYAHETATQGIEQGVSIGHLQAHDASTGTPLWDLAMEAPGPVNDSPGINCTGTASSDLATALTQTADGRYAIIQLGGHYTQIVNLDRGTARKDPDVLRAVGRWGVIPEAAPPDGFEPERARLTDPRTGAVVGMITDRVISGSFEEVNATTSAGDVLAGRPGSSYPDDVELAAVNLPSGSRRWILTSGASPSGWGGNVNVEPKTDTLINYSLGYGEEMVLAVSMRSGKILWSLGELAAEYCGSDNGKVFVVANDQFAILDALTGEQLDYRANIDECPTILPGVIRFDDGFELT